MLKYLKEQELKKAISEYFNDNKDDDGSIYNDGISDVDDILDEVLDIYNIWADNTQFDFRNYLVDCGSLYIYIIARRISDNMEFIIDSDFFLPEQGLTEEMIYNAIVGLDTLLQNKVKEYKL